MKWLLSLIIASSVFAENIDYSQVSWSGDQHKMIISADLLNSLQKAAEQGDETAQYILSKLPEGVEVVE